MIGAMDATTNIPKTNRDPATYEQKVALSVIIVVLGVWSTAGNVLTILAITARRYMRTKTNIFILSLAISDLLSGVVASPLWLYRRTWGFDPWEWGWFPCKLYWFMEETTAYCTCMHIASFAVWRYMKVKGSLKPVNCKMRTITIWVGVMWIVAVLFGGLIFSTFVILVEKPPNGTVYAGWPMCSVDIHRISTFTMYYTFASTTFLLFPMVLLFAMSGLIANELFCTKKIKGELRKTRERRAARQLGLIAMFFLIGYVPMEIYVNWTSRTPKLQESMLRFDYWFGVAVYLCLRLSECFNPIAYNIASSKMRKASKEVLSYLWSCCGLRELPATSLHAATVKPTIDQRGRLAC